MPISAVDQSNLVGEFGQYVEESDTLKGIFLPVGVAGEAAKRTEVLVVLGAVLDALYGVAAPTILP
jgi:hypothetical protein